jgi:hypothetical protein
MPAYHRKRFFVISRCCESRRSRWSTLAAIKNVDHLQVNQTIYDLNGPLTAIRFRMDGSGMGVIWQVLPEARGKRAADGQATNRAAKPSRLRRTKRGRREK